MMTARRLLAAAALASGLSAVTAAGSPAVAAGSAKPAKAVGPFATAWYDVTRATDTAPGLPQPGVGKHDLVVDGITVDAGQLPVAPPVTVPVAQRVAAIAAMAFTLPKHTSAGTLRLDLTGTTLSAVEGRLPGGVSPVACPTTSKWKHGGQQAGSDAPTYNCKKRKVVGQLGGDKTSIEFTSIGRLARGRKLSFVILPGTIGLERLIFADPGPDALKLLSFDQPVPTPTLPPDSNPTKTTHPATGGGTSTGGGFAGSGTNLPPIGKVTVPSDTGSGTAPTLAGSTSPEPVAQLTGAKPLDDKRARWAAIALLVGLIAGTAWLGSTRVATVTEWGVGRFRSVRSGLPPTI